MISKNDLTEARAVICETDAEIAKLFCRRMRACESIAAYKKEHGLQIRDPLREAALLAQNAALIEDPVLREYYSVFLEKTMELSRIYQSRLVAGQKIAYSGTVGAFAHIASSKLFPTAELCAFPGFSAAYRAVEAGSCDGAVLPVENSSNGDVGQVTDLLFAGSLAVNAAYELPITQDLLGLPDASAEDITDVVSHPQALGQCEEYLKSRSFVRHEYANTALAAQFVAEQGNRHFAAIACGDAAAFFGLKVLERNIQQSRTNTTRFLVCTKSREIPSPEQRGVRSILIFTVRNEAGALAKALQVIGEYGFNMLTLRSRPRKELLWQYYFYAELEGNIYNDAGSSLLKELAKFCDFCKIVGTYIQNQEVAAF